MTVDLTWLALQPEEEADKGKVAADGGGETAPSDAPPTPLAPSEGRHRAQGDGLSEIEPASPREAAAGSGGRGGSSFQAAAGSSRTAADPDGGGGGSRSAQEGREGEEEQLVMQKHLAFNSPQARHWRVQRLSATSGCIWAAATGWGSIVSRLVRYASCGAGLKGEFIAWIAAAGRAAEVACLAVVARITLLVLAPSILHFYLLLYAPGTYRRHRELLSLVLRSPFDIWVVATQDAPELGIGGPVVHRGIPPPCKLLLMMVFQFVMAPLVACQPFVHSYAYSTALLALWLGRHMRHASGWLLAALLVLYAGPLVSLFRNEAR
ncbi:hypothetical protein C2E21_8421 [Chlorella sorokiniana]|uniref:Uncharacterized protein n=1 Tax=Chlorella sorokiniana TaxID=3076 RepID=A0A2P6TEQ1_CHLSO|nr:hypothetical protein C2E21_8421 [Chlorella sorokiniana]|eukprot:PRW21107.1 hypothetical protein C2E21_8421 [Chlorella sorokiniana]